MQQNTKVLAMQKVYGIMSSPNSWACDAVWLEAQIVRLLPAQKIAVRALMEWERTNRQIIYGYDVDCFIGDKLRVASEPFDKGAVFAAKSSGLNFLLEAFLEHFTPYMFHKVEKNSFNEKPDDDPDALYSWEIYYNDGILGSSLDYREVEVMLDFWGIAHARQLSCQTFWVPKEYKDPSAALDFFIIQIRNDGTYVPPAADELYERAAQALARMEHPTYLDVDSQTVFSVFFRAYTTQELDWLTWLRKRVAELSEGIITIVEADASEFNYRIQGPARYLRLCRGDSSQRFTFGPYSTPFGFDR